MDGSCLSCLLEAMGKLWFHQNILLFEPPGISLQSIVKRRRIRAAASVNHTTVPEKCSHSEICQSTAVGNSNNTGSSDHQRQKPKRLNIVVGQQLFQLQQSPRKTIQSHSLSPDMSTGSQAKRRSPLPRKRGSQTSPSQLERYEPKGSPRKMSSPLKLTEVHGRITASRHRDEEPSPHPAEDWMTVSADGQVLDLQILTSSPHGVDMKKHLRYWAREVAYLVQYET